MLSQNSLIKSSNKDLERSKDLSEVTEQAGELQSPESGYEVQHSVCCCT